MQLLLLLLGCQGPGEGEGAVDTQVEIDPGDFLLDPPIECPAPLPGPQWSEVGEAWGLRGTDADEVFHVDGGGMALADLDGDGDEDLVLGFLLDLPRIYWREGDGFVEEALTDFLLFGFVRVIDLDQDGDLDVVGLGDLPFLASNEGGRFRVSSLEGLAEMFEEVIREIVPFGHNSSGGLELYVGITNPSQDPDTLADRIAHQQADGSFVLEALDPALVNRKAFDLLPFDWDGDGDLDVYVVNDMGPWFGGNVLWKNEGGQLVDATGDCDCGIEASPMGASPADGDGDGILDLYVAATNDSVLLRGQPDGSFVDVTASVGADPVEGQGDMAWGSLWLDHDNDGDLDLLVARGDLWDLGSEDGSHFESPLNLLSQEDLRFVDLGASLGLATTGSHRAVLARDLNGDGVLDLIASDVEGPPLLYMSGGCTAAGWVALDLPEHARAEVEAGGRTYTAWATADPGFSASQEPEIWLGLGAAQQIDRLTVVELDGTEHRIEGPFPARRHIRLE